MPLVTVLLAAHNDARYLPAAIDSVLRQTFRDLELVLVDDASSDETAGLVDRVSDGRLVVLRNDRQQGLAASLNRGLESARGELVARLDADDVARPDRLERQVAHIRSARLAIVGSAVRDADETGRAGRVHRMPRSTTAVRWHALFSSPFFHPTVLVSRAALEDHALRYDPAFLESEDYDLWTRLFATGAEGGNLAEPLVRKRVHPGQASLRRRDLQQSFQRRVALREIARLAPDLDAEAAWSYGIGAAQSRDGARAYGALLEAFEHVHGGDGEVRRAAARVLARGREPARAARALARRPALPPALSRVRVTVVSPEPTPYRAPLFDRLARREDIDLSVVYAARTVAGRTWSVSLGHRATFLRGAALPGMRMLVHHDYPVTPGVVRALAKTRPQVVVVSGWSTFASQAAIAWCRMRRVPYVLLVESHDAGRRPGWRRAVKGAVVPRLVRGSAGALAVGTLAKESLVARGADAGSVRIFANTIDVDGWADRADRLRAERLDSAEIVVLSVARLAPEKGLDVLVRAVAAAGDARLRLVLVGDGPERAALTELAASLAVPMRRAGDLGEDDVARAYADADVFALLSRREPWAVVVNEAAASALPLVLSDAVGAARDLVSEGDNGFVVPAGDVDAAAAALRSLAADPDLRRRMGARSRELVRGWGYDPSVEAFVAAVREAASR